MTILSRTEIAPRGGVAIWRQIADALRLDIVGGKLGPGDRLPGELVLAERFGAHRHTVRRALAVLAEEGVVRAEHGRGTFVADTRRLSYPIGRRTRFTEGLAGQIGAGTRRLLTHKVERASARVAEGLALKPGTRVIRLETLSLADGRPVSRATGWLPEARFPDFATRFLETGSVTATLARYGIADYVRATTRITARHATPEEARDLELAPGAVLLVSEGIDATPEGTPINLLLTRFPADRLELVV